MGILYGLVARGSVVLAEFSATSTNASAIARQILEKIPGNNDMNVSYSQDRYIFHVKRTDGLTVLCMADDTAGRRIPFAFLEDIHQRFVRTYGRAVLSAHAYGMNDEFSRVLSQQMEYYTNDPNADRINRLKGEMSQVRNVMIENIDKVLERGDRLELLVDKTANMQGNTFRFRKQTRRFRSTVWWRNVKLTVALIILLLVIAYVVLAFVCKGPLLPSCIKMLSESVPLAMPLNNECGEQEEVWSGGIEHEEEVWSGHSSKDCDEIETTKDGKEEIENCEDKVEEPKEGMAFDTSEDAWM